MVSLPMWCKKMLCTKLLTRVTHRALTRYPAGFSGKLRLLLRIDCDGPIFQCLEIIEIVGGKTLARYSVRRPAEIGNPSGESRNGLGDHQSRIAMTHLLSTEDRDFQAQFESRKSPPAEFNHRAHLRLPYAYLAEHDTETAHRLMREALQHLLEHNSVDISKCHETMTRAWIMAVRHFLEGISNSESSDSFIEQNPTMLYAKIMMTHYSPEVLLSDEACARFVEPDLGPISRYGG